MSLTVKDLIAMSRFKDCLNGALLFVKEVVMMSIVASHAAGYDTIIVIKITALATFLTCSTFMYTTFF